MTGIHGLEHVKRFACANLAHDNAIRTHTQSVLHEIALVYLAAPFNVGRAGFQPSDVALLQLEFGRVFNGDDAFALVDEARQGIQHRGFTRAGSARDKHIAARAHDGSQHFRHWFRHRTQINQLLHADRDFGELTNRKQRAIKRQRSDDRIYAAAVAQTGIDKWRAFIDPAADRADNFLNDPHQMLLILESHTTALQHTATLDKDGVCAVYQDISDAFIFKQRLYRSKTQQLVKHFIDEASPLFAIEWLVEICQQLRDDRADLCFDLLFRQLVEHGKVDPFKQSLVDCHAQL